jgi:hypothetical protein
VLPNGAFILGSGWSRCVVAGGRDRRNAQVGAYLVGDPPRLVTEEEAERLLGKKPTPLIAPPVVEPIASDGLIEAEMIEIEDETKTQPICDAGVTLSREAAIVPEVDPDHVFVVRSAGLSGDAPVSFRPRRASPRSRLQLLRVWLQLG